LGGKLQISVGDISETLRPALFIFAVLCSTYALSSARRRFGSYATVAWTLLTLLFPPIVLPLYLIARIYTPRPDLPAPVNLPPSVEADEQAPQSLAPQSATGEAGAPSSPTNEGDTVESDGQAPSLSRSRLALPLIYAVTALLLGALYFYWDYSSFEARFARARQAELYNQRERAAREYRAALAVRDDARTRQLLGMELARAERWEEALAEFRAARMKGEPDDRLLFHEAHALDKLNRPTEATETFRRFLQSQSCAPPDPDPLCGAAHARLQTQTPPQ
jgi:hypothetical protein